MPRWILLVVGMGVLLTASAGRAAEPVRLRVLTYNMHHGEGTDGKLDLARIARVIHEAEPDLVALQEVDRKTMRTGGIDQPAELARLTGLQAVFERNIAYEGGDYGNAVLTRLPVKRHRNHLLPSHDQGEQRGVLEVEVEAGKVSTPVRFLATHLDHRARDAERLDSARKIEELTRAWPNAPAVLAGDLNARPETAVLDLFRKRWAVAGDGKRLASFPAEKPDRLLDYILCRPAGHLKVLDVRVLEEPVASDHRPVLAVLEWSPR